MEYWPPGHRHYRILTKKIVSVYLYVTKAVITDSPIRAAASWMRESIVKWDRRQQLSS